MKSSERLRKLRKWLTLGVAAVFLSIQPLTASAEVQYFTNSRDAAGSLIWTQPAYFPVEIIGAGLTIPDKDKPGAVKNSPMTNPKDVFVDSKDHIYVADTGNSRVVEFDQDGNWLRYITVPENPLNKPEGVFVTPEGDIYVADTANKRVVRLTPDGKFVRDYQRPNSKYIPDSFKYDPIKLVVDKRGYLYIATLGGYQGLLQLDPSGQFQSFYGANTTELSALDKMKKALYTKQMYSNEISKLPGSISSVAVDRSGFIYTTTSGQVSKNQIKKLNIKGQNMLDKGYINGKKTSLTFGEIRPMERKYVSGQGYLSPQLSDLTIDINGNITAFDTAYKIYSQYDALGHLLYFWGGQSSDQTTQLGVIKSPVAIDSNSKGEMLILDGQEGTVQVFRQTEFGALVNKANAYTLQGRYEEGESVWKEVLRYNAYFTPALNGLGKAAFKRGDFELAKQYFYESGSKREYSDAFWQIRLVWFQKHFGTFATIVLFGSIILLLGNRLTRNAKWRLALKNRRRSTKTLIVQLKHMFTIVRHPIDGFTALRYENKGSYLSALIILALVFASIVVSKLYTGFTFNSVNPHRLNLLTLFGQNALIWLGWVISNYFVSSIYRGEGRFRDVFVASSYALTPLMFIGVPLAIISNVMTTSEQPIYDFLGNAMTVWVVFMFIWKIQALQNYSVGETAVNILFSLFAFIMISVLILIIFGLSSDLRSFIIEIYQEVRLR